MKTYDASEMQVRLNECGEGEYVRREVAERLYKALAVLMSNHKDTGGSIYQHKRYLDANDALDFAEEN